MIRRILVALDASPGSLAAAEAAADIAVLLEAELRGLFVEDADLLRLVEHPLARELDLLTLSPRDAETDDVEGQLKVHARRAEETLGRLAKRAGIPYSFQVARGTVAGEILAAAGEADLVSLGRVGWTTRQKRDLGTTAKTLIAGRRGRVMLLERRVAVRAPVIVLHDGSEAGRDALRLAGQLASRGRGSLTVLLVGEDEEALRSEVADELGPETPARWLGRPRGPALALAVSCRQSGVVVVPVASRHLGQEHLQALLDAVACPVLAVS
ncbi:MAG: universal stress protein [bacterium]|nr:universal stress protein [bacterium]